MLRWRDWAGRATTCLGIAGLVLVQACGGTRVPRPADLETMVQVPAGEFTRGSEDGEEDERPVRKLFLDTFYIDRLEVTNAQYKTFCDAANFLYPENPYWDEDYFHQSPNHPVLNVTYDQAAAYCRWAGKRLPTEAEWEKAARGTDGRRYPWGDEWDASRANMTGEKNDPYLRAAPVGSFPQGASPYGVLDITGNVWEWVHDWYETSYYAVGPARNPAGPPGPTPWRTVRGGSYTGPESDARVSNRSKAPPSQALYHIGCRCAWSAHPPTPVSPKP